MLHHGDVAAETRLAFAVDGVSKLFFGSGRPLWALREMALNVEEGSFTTVVGPSGCGKSTLLRIFGDLEKPSSGTVVRPRDEDGRPATAFVFQTSGVLPWLTVFENVLFGLSRWYRRTECAERARDWIARTALSGFEGAYPYQLSGGMRQRVGIARAFATGSACLLMDEPLGALDAQTRLLMQEELLTLCETERKTVVLVTHALEEALLLGDRVVLMTARPGRVRAEIEVPFGRPRHPDVQHTKEFAELRGYLWDLLRREVEARPIAS
ncbi:ABC transporter ATP-binding protein [Nocardia sp. CDC159]|uniref:ABC transporter ATP-binding protein n=1 Tax=Nocardia pulmonis TaxID=2951408 RepID=A0A9X2EI56_9NOCA|nr:MULTISPECIES: ABC transporter ATP-binding protein [Nocardia]MCM6778471.1 ABC transporter ATP-binding protein [Nocardia pulmonis]MCM6791360.1 ABC transporter ATP-binding protein [Nocardia sp. CDC159]